MYNAVASNTLAVIQGSTLLPFLPPPQRRLEASNSDACDHAISATCKRGYETALSAVELLSVLLPIESPPAVTHSN